MDNPFDWPGQQGLQPPQTPLMLQPPPQQDLGAVAQPQLQPGPPANPQDLAQRTSGWDAFFQQLSRPEVAQSLINAGATMLQPRTRGQSQAGKISEGVAVGAATYSQKQTQAQEEQRKNKVVGQRDTALKQTEEQIGLEKQRVGQETARLDMQQEQHQKTLALLDEQIAAAKDANTPESRKLADNLTIARTAAENANANYQNALAATGGRTSAAAQELATVAQAYVQSGQAKSIPEGILKAFAAKHAKGQKTTPEIAAMVRQSYAAVQGNVLLKPEEKAAIEEAVQADINQVNTERSGAAGGGATPEQPPAPPTQVNQTLPGFNVMDNIQGGTPSAPTTPTAPPPPAVTRTPTDADITSYRQHVLMYPSPVDKAKIDAKWLSIFGTAPPAIDLSPTATGPKAFEGAQQALDLGKTILQRPWISERAHNAGY